MSLELASLASTRPRALWARHVLGSASSLCAGGGEGSASSSP
jgi:hypothetical protein